MRAGLGSCSPASLPWETKRNDFGDSWDDIDDDDENGDDFDETNHNLMFIEKADASGDND